MPGLPNGLNGAHDDDEDIEIDYSEIEAKYALKELDPFDNIILIDGVPIVKDEAKARKLLQLIVKRLAERNVRVSEGDIEMPFEGTDSKGFVFVTCSSPDDAARAVRDLDQYQPDRKHTFHVYHFKDVQAYFNTSDSFTAPAEDEYVERGHLRSWLGDEASRDQVGIVAGNTTTVGWFSRTRAVEAAVERENWTDRYIQWSTQGTYMATIHPQGIQLWGSGGLDRIGRFAHAAPALIDFSPNDRYLVTWSPTPISLPGANYRGPPLPFGEEDVGNCIAVWEIATGKLLRTFPMPDDSGPDGAHKFVWPQLKFSGDERYVARLVYGQMISIYTVPDMAMLDKKSIKIDGVRDFEWRPLGDKERDELEAEEAEAEKAGSAGGKAKAKKEAREEMIAYWTPEADNQPARVSIIAIPSRKTLRSKNLFNVFDCKLHWQSNGDFLCVKVDRHTKTKKSTFCNLELFRLRDKDIPVETVELKDTVMLFSWEPKGDRFAMITTADPTPAPGASLKTSVTFYQLDTRKGDFRLLRTFDGRTTNRIDWSPKGRHIILASVEASKGEFDFYDLDLERADKADADKKDEAGQSITLIWSGEHYGMSEIIWDPSGRFVCTVSSVWPRKLEPGYKIWDITGSVLSEVRDDGLKQVLWRPRPRTLLSKEDQRQVRRNLREFSRDFDEQDELARLNESQDKIEGRKRLLSEWAAWRQQNRAALEEVRAARNLPLPKRLRILQEEAVEEVEEMVEEILEEKEEIVG